MSGSPRPVTKAQELLGLDKRSLALFRICLGVVVIMDALTRLPDARAHYSDEGILPRYVAVQHFWNHYWFCFHLLNGSWKFQAMLFLIQASCGLSLAVGFYTQTSVVLSWLMVCSAQSRNNLIGYGGDVYMRVLLFWAVFLPLGSCYSIDRTFFKRKKRINSVMCFSGGTIALIFQIVYLYVFSYIHKTGDEWNVHGTATYYALNMDFFRTSFGDLMLLFPNLLTIMTFGVLYFEGFGSLLFFSPVFTQQIRTLGALLFMGMHIGFGAAMSLGIFSPICCVGVLPMLTPWFWDRVVFRALESPARLNFKVYYARNFVSEKLAHAVADFLLIPKTEVRSIQEVEEGTSLDSTTAIYVGDSYGRRYAGFAAVKAICEVSPLLSPIHYVLNTRYGAKFGGAMFSAFNFIYDSMLSEAATEPCSNVMSSAKRTSSTKTIRRSLSSLLAILLIVLCFSWNCSNVDISQLGVPRAMLWIGWVTHLEQMWSMFSPRPPNANWWYTIEGTLDDGRKVELWQDRGIFTWKSHPAPYNREIPTNMGWSIGNHRWFKFYESMNAGPLENEMRLPFGRYICREYNKRHPGKDRVHSFNIIYRTLLNQLDGTRVPLPDATFWSHVCYDKPKN